MKNILFFVVGIILGIITIDCATDAVVCLFHFALLATLWNVGLSLLFGHLSLNFFKKM